MHPLKFMSSHPLFFCRQKCEKIHTTATVPCKYFSFYFIFSLFCIPPSILLSRLRHKGSLQLRGDLTTLSTKQPLWWTKHITSTTLSTKPPKPWTNSPKASRASREISGPVHNNSSEHFCSLLVNAI